MLYARESLLTRIVKGSNDTAGRGREASLNNRGINLLTGLANDRRWTYLGPDLSLSPSLPPAPVAVLRAPAPVRTAETDWLSFRDHRRGWFSRAIFSCHLIIPASGWPDDSAQPFSRDGNILTSLLES